jgi:hypothetical protein
LKNKKEWGRARLQCRLCCAVVAVTVLISTCSCRCDWYQRFWNGADSEWCICPRLTVAEHDQKTGKSYIYFISKKNINHDKRTTGSAHTCLLLPEDIAECNKILCLVETAISPDKCRAIQHTLFMLAAH